MEGFALRTVRRRREIGKAESGEARSVSDHPLLGDGSATKGVEDEQELENRDFRSS
jgi:hypothetical protein